MALIHIPSNLLKHTLGQNKVCVPGSSLKSVIDNLSDISGSPIKNIRIVGGGANNKLLNQMSADITGLVVEAGPIEATAAGNILGQLISIEILPSLAAGHKIIERSFETVSYYPNESDPIEFDYPNFISVLSNSL